MLEFVVKELVRHMLASKIKNSITPLITICAEIRRIYEEDFDFGCNSFTNRRVRF